MNIDEFAAAIGVSRGTVSSAITGRGRISPATREMVVRKMQELGFVPNSNARRLTSGRSFLIGLWNTSEHKRMGPYTLEITRVLLDHLTERDYDLLHHRGGRGDQERQALTQRIRSRVSDGTIVLGYFSVLDMIRHLASAGHPFVGVELDYEPNPPFPHMGCISIALRPGIRQVAQLLHRQGHSKVAYVYERLRDGSFDVFKEELATVGIALGDNDATGYGYDPDDGAKAFAELMSRSEPPTGIFFRNDLLALGAIFQAARMGIRIPEDVSIVGHDDLPLLAPARQSLTTVHIDVAEIGKLVAETMFELLDDPSAIVPTKHVQGELVERQTVGPAPTRER